MINTVFFGTPEGKIEVFKFLPRCAGYAKFYHSSAIRNTIEIFGASQDLFLSLDGMLSFSEFPLLCSITGNIVEVLFVDKAHNLSKRAHFQIWLSRKMRVAEKLNLEGFS